MMRSISERWAESKAAAWAAGAMPRARRRANAPGTSRDVHVMRISLSVPTVFLRRACLHDVVGLQPCGRPARQARLRPRGLFAGALPVAVAQIALRGRDHGLALLALERIGPGQGAIGDPDLRFRRDAALQLADRLVEDGPVLGRDERVSEPDAHQRGARRETDGLAVGRDRLAGPAELQQDIALELVEKGVIRLGADELVDLRERGARIAVLGGRD